MTWSWEKFDLMSRKEEHRAVNCPKKPAFQMRTASVTAAQEEDDHEHGREGNNKKEAGNV